MLSIFYIHFIVLYLAHYFKSFTFNLLLFIVLYFTHYFYSTFNFYHFIILYFTHSFYITFFISFYITFFILHLQSYNFLRILKIHNTIQLLVSLQCITPRQINVSQTISTSQALESSFNSFIHYSL